jgi:hypothetical protein
LPCHGGGSATRYIAAAMAEASDPPLPLDAQRALELAARSMFDTFARTAMGTMVVDREHRIVWISEGYKRFLPALGFASATSSAARRGGGAQHPDGQVIDSGSPSWWTC